MTKGMKKTIVGLSIGFSVVLLLVLVLAGCNYYVEYTQIKEIGSNFGSVFSRNVMTQTIVQFTSFIIVLFAIFFSLMRVRKTMLKEDEETFHFLEPVFPIWLISFIFAIIASNLINKAIYSNFLMFANTTEWGISDPIFGQDISYYVFIRPFLISVLDSLMGLAIFIAGFVAVFYVLLYGRLGITNLKALGKNKKIVSHIVFNLLMIILIRLLSYRFRAEDILFSEFANMTGAGFTHVNIWLKYYMAVPYISILIVGGILFFVNKGKYKYSVYTALIFPVIVIAVTASALITQHFQVNPAEAQVEAPYTSHHITATRTAYGLADIEKKNFPIDNTFQAQDVISHNEEIGQISLLDPVVSQDILGQLQGIRNYYEFLDVDTVAYKIDGQKEAVMISPRELRKLDESPTSQQYSNDKMHFTHGYGIVAFPANQITEAGHPVLYVKDTPILSSVTDIKVSEPRIYYSEYRDDYSVVNTAIKEFDHLKNGQKVETEYSGESGIPMTFMNRMLFAFRYGDYQLFASKHITPESKLLINTNVIDRVKVAAPFLNFDENPYILADANGRLKWIVDAYTTTNYFPYAKILENESFEDEFNYIRNSAKAVVDAYDGTVQIYITDPTDKLITVYQKIYPEVFTKEDFPEDLKYSMRYPETYFKIQTEILKEYHIQDAVTFFNRSDNWEIAKEIRSETSSWKDSISEDQQKSAVKPSYQMVTTDGKQNLKLMIPFTVEGKDNMVAWFSAGSDGDCYGKLTLYEIPQESTVYGPLQIEKRINSDPEIDGAMSVFGSGESTIIRGNLITVPIENSILYVEPIYVTAGKNTFPELKKVVAAYDSKIAIGPTLDEAVAALFPVEGSVNSPETETVTAGSGTPSQDTVQPIQPVDPINPIEQIQPENSDITDVQKVTDAFRKVQEASQTNDWEAFGKAMNDLEVIINELNGIESDLTTAEEAAS